MTIHYGEFNAIGMENPLHKERAYRDVLLSFSIGVAFVFSVLMGYMYKEVIMNLWKGWV